MTQLVRLVEACSTTGCAYIRAWRAVTAGSIPFVRRGRWILVDPKHLKPMVARDRAEAHDERPAAA